MGDLPSRAVPMMWKEKSASRPESQPAEFFRQNMDRHFIETLKLLRAPTIRRPVGRNEDDMQFDLLVQRRQDRIDGLDGALAGGGELAVGLL